MDNLDDDDTPPPLSSLAEQIDALRLRGKDDGSASGGSVRLPSEDLLRVANVVIKPQDSSKATSLTSKAAAAPALKKGFFDAAPKRRTRAQTGLKPAEPVVEEIPILRAKKNPAGGPAIPDFLRVEPDEQEKRYAAMKADLLDKLKPSPDMVSKIGKDPGLLASFDDPEVMAAVNDIAANPANFKKYKDKPKVVAFYAAMGKLMGEKLEKMGQGAAKPGSS